MVKARAMDLHNIEKIKKVKLLGIIGYDVIKDREIVIDFMWREITLIKMDRKGNTDRRLVAVHHPTDTIAVKMLDHLLYVNVQIGKSKFKLGIDSGSEKNIIVDRHKTIIKDYLYSKKVSKIIGLNGVEVESAIYGELEQMQLGQIIYNPMKTVIMDTKIIGESGFLDGFLGVEFLQQYKIAINYKKKELYIWDHKKQIRDVLVSAKDSSLKSEEVKKKSGLIRN